MEEENKNNRTQQEEEKTEATEELDTQRITDRTLFWHQAKLGSFLDLAHYVRNI